MSFFYLCSGGGDDDLSSGWEGLHYVRVIVRKQPASLGGFYQRCVDNPDDRRWVPIVRRQKSLREIVRSSPKLIGDHAERMTGKGVARCHVVRMLVEVLICIVGGGSGPLGRTKALRSKGERVTIVEGHSSQRSPEELGRRDGHGKTF